MWSVLAHSLTLCAQGELVYELRKGGATPCESVTDQIRFTFCGDTKYHILNGADRTDTGASVESVWLGFWFFVFKHIMKHFAGDEVHVMIPTRLNVTFPYSASPEQRALLYAATVFIDYLYFGGKGQTQAGRDQLVSFSVS